MARGVYSRFSPADSSGGSDHSLHGRSISAVYFISSKFNSSISGITSWLQQNTIWIGCFCAALSSAAEKQKRMLILQCIVYHQGEEDLMRFDDVYHCGGEILGVFYIPPRSLSLLHRAEQRRQKHWGLSPVIFQLKSISTNSKPNSPPISISALLLALVRLCPFAVAENYAVVPLPTFLMT